MTRSSIVMMTTGLALLGGVTACGRVAPEDKPHQARPPAQQQITAVIGANGVHLSPTKISGGPVWIIVSNQSPKAARARLVAPGGGGASTRDKIPPHAVGGIRTELEQGVYRLRGGNGKAATLTVGARRPSSDGDLMQP